VAEQFLAWIRVPPARRWLDVGCGTGALTQTVLALADPAAVTGLDPSPAFVRHAAGHVTDPRASFQVGDAQALPLAAASADAVVSGLALNFVPDRQAALLEMARVARPGGVVALYVWDYAGEMELTKLFWDVAVELDPSAFTQHEGVRFDFCRPDLLRELFVGAGLEDVEARAVLVPTRFADFDDFWQPFLGGQGPAPAYAVSLPEPARDLLRDTLRERLPVETDGSVQLRARAWALRGRRT
jgi:SAM-dependent methyltransferase